LLVIDECDGVLLHKIMVTCTIY